jgi:hypothetical protein
MEYRSDGFRQLDSITHHFNTPDFYSDEIHAQLA